MRNSTTRNRSRLMAIAAAMILGVTLSASAALAITSGTLTITGTRWVNGVPHKVRCTAADGHQIAYADGKWIHLLPGTSACDVYADTSDVDVLHFEGAASSIEKNGVMTDSAIWNSSQTAGGPSGSDPAHGTMTGVTRYVNGIPVSEKGTISYWRVDSANQTIIFIGKYKVGHIQAF
jgi:hypothetical protein